MKYDVLTVDTNIFTANGYDLEGGLLSKLAQFKDNPARFVLSEVVIRELHAHLVEQARDAKINLEKAANRAAFCKISDTSTLENIRQLSAITDDAKISVARRLKAFMHKTGAAIVKASETNVDEVVKHYFETRPPFDKAGKKKSEFPDAIALLSIEAWAVNKGFRVLAVSKDTGWRDFAEHTDVIDVVEDLTDGLSSLQEDVDIALLSVKAFLSDLDHGLRPDTMSIIQEAIAIQTSLMDFDAEASAAYETDNRYIEASFLSFAFENDGSDNYYVDVIEVSPVGVIVRVDLKINALFRAGFDLFVIEGVEKDTVSMGTCDARIESEFDAQAVITFTGDYGDVASLEIDVVELIDGRLTVDFGYIEPDFESEGDVDDWYGDLVNT